MIRSMLLPFLKKFLGLFISMVFVSMLSISMLSAFASTIYNLRETFRTYLYDNGNVSAFASVNFTEKSNLEDVTTVEGVKAAEFRLTMDAFLQKSDGRTITVRIFTFKDDDSSIMKRYVLESVKKSDDKINVSVVRKFAVNNNFKVGDSLKIGYFDTYLDFYVNEIVETPEAIQARANNYVWSDNTDIGYIYVKEGELNKAISQLAVILEQKIVADETFASYYDSIVNTVGITFPDIVNMGDYDRFTSAYANQILITGEDGYSEEEIASNVRTYLEEKSLRSDSVIENGKMFYYVYIENAIKQLQVAAIFLPVFFYSVAMIVIGLFVNQIIKAMTPQIGVMMSIGVGKKDIISIFVAFTFIMSVIAGILGVALSFGISSVFVGTMIRVYSMPTIPYAINPLIAALSVVSFMIFTQIATVLSCRAILKITPKDATISNEAKRRRISAKTEAFIERAPMTVKLGINSIAQNPRRFFVSVFAIFASFMIIVMAMFFNVSKNAVISQTVETRMNYDAQVYTTSVANDALINEVKNHSSVTEFIDAYYTYAQVSDVSGKNGTYTECVAYDHGAQTDLIVIPSNDGNGRVDIKESGVILPFAVADKIGVKKGDTILINGSQTVVEEVSYQYFHSVTYMSKSEMERLGIEHVSTFFVNVDSADDFLAFMSAKNVAFTVFTQNLSKDINNNLNSINSLIYAMIGFSLSMGFIILLIMSQNALMEQKRQVSVFRAIGFTITDVSNLWALQSISQLILSSLFAIPLAALASSILFKMCSNAATQFPFIFNVPVVLFALAFIFIIILASHLISILSVKRWVLADNLRTRE